MVDVYHEFLEMIQSYIPDAKDRFQSPATLEEINQLEKKLSKKIPDDFLEFYQKANGEGEILGCILGFDLMSIDRIQREHQFYLEINDLTVKSYQKGLVKEGKYNSGWLPIADDGGGSFFLMDLDPGELGSYGQIITLDRESDISYVIASSFRELLLHTIPQELKNGNLCVEEDGEFIFLTWHDGHYFNGIEKRFK